MEKRNVIISSGRLENGTQVRIWADGTIELMSVGSEASAEWKVEHRRSSRGEYIFLVPSATTNHAFNPEELLLRAGYAYLDRSGVPRDDPRRVVRLYETIPEWFARVSPPTR